MSAWQKGIKYAALALAILLIASIVGGIFQILSVLPWLRGGREDAVGEMQDYVLSEEIRSLEIDLTAAELTLCSGNRFAVSSNLSGLSVTSKAGLLTIEEKGGWTSGRNRGRVALTIPRDTVFDRVRVNTGAGLVTIEDLETEELDLDLGAGKVKISRLCAAENADIDGGVGSLTISSGELRNLNLDMGVGKLELTSKLTGWSKLDMGVGTAELTLIDQESYRISVDKGLGEISVAENSMEDGAMFGSGDTPIQINGGVGSVRITFRPEVSPS